MKMNRLTIFDGEFWQHKDFPPVSEGNVDAFVDCVKELATRLAAYEDAEEQGLLVRLPCKVGGAMWVVTKCKNVVRIRDDNYLDGTGKIMCPFESSCGFKDCDDNHIRIFETTVTDFWYGNENCNRTEIFLNGLTIGCTRQDVGKAVFLTYEAAKAALAEMTNTDAK